MQILQLRVYSQTRNAEGWFTLATESEAEGAFDRV